jgi:uncharacterized membrane protein YoaT (DUF817 family)
LHDPRRIRPVASAAAQWALLARFIAVEERLGLWAGQRRTTAFIYEFLRFGVKQAWACLFGGAMVALLIGTHLWYPRGAALARYDFIFLAAVAIQIGMLAFKLETFDEAKVILIYHVVGTVMEVFKTDVGSWIYPEPCIFRIAGVPLFSGFMYASIGSYIARSWRLFDFRFSRHPPLWAVNLLALAVYANFFTHHFITDLRIPLFAAAGAAVRSVVDLLPHPLHLSADAAAARLVSGSAVHLARGERRHLQQNLALSAADGRMVAGPHCQARLVVPFADYQLRAGRDREPAEDSR